MSDSVRPQRRQPTRLPRPWDSPGKSTGVGCHFLLQCMKVKSGSKVAQSCPTLRDPMDCSPPGSSVHGIFQARGLEWGAIAFSQNGLLGPTYSPKSLSHLTAHKTLSTLAVIQVHFTSPVPVPATGFLYLLLPQPRTVFIPLLVLFFGSQVQSCQPSLNPVTKSNRSLGSPVL